MRKALLSLALLLSLSFPAISGMALSGAIDSSGTANITIAAEFIGAAGESACINLSSPVSDVAVRDRSGLILESEIGREGNNTLICAVVPTDYLEYGLTSASFTAKSGSLWEYDLAIGASKNVSYFNASLSLPEGATLKGTNGAVQSGGDSLMLTWSAADIDTAHKARMRASYELAPAPAQADYAAPAFVLLLATAVIIAVVWILRRQMLSVLDRNRQAAPRQGVAPSVAPGPLPASSLESNDVFKTLDETDKEIIREILRQGGKTTQAHLYLHTHVPKATLSRRLASMENRGIIQKSQKGNRNLVSLADFLKK